MKKEFKGLIKVTYRNGLKFKFYLIKANCDIYESQKNLYFNSIKNEVNY